MLDESVLLGQLNSQQGDDQRPIRLTKDDQNKVVKIEIYVDKKQRCEIFKYFPDKTIGSKEAAPHFLLLKCLAAYEKENIVNPVKGKNKTAIQNLTQLTKNLCHATAPLYSLINDSYLENSFHPANIAWEDFKQKQELKSLNQTRLKIAFIKDELIKYQKKVNTILVSPEGITLRSQEAIQKFHKSHEKATQKFIAQLDRLDAATLSEDQLKKLLSNQDKMDALSIGSLGSFLRAQAHELAEDALSTVDDLTQARFDQLFSFSAHPLHKELAAAKKAIGDLESTQMARFLNTQSTIPAGQLAVLSNDDTPSEEKRWMDIMPYVNCKTFLGEGIEGSEGIDDVDQILTVYANGSAPIKKASWFHEALKGKESTVQLLAIIFLGLPAMVGGVVCLAAGACLAIIFDLVFFLLQAAIFLLFSPIIVFAAVADLCCQLPSFFAETAENQFSFLAIIMNWGFPPQWLKDIMKWDCHPQWLNNTLRDFSLVRIFKQFLLDGSIFDRLYKMFKQSSKEGELADRLYYQPVNPSCLGTLDIQAKNHYLDIIKENQAEGLFNVVARKIFSFNTIAVFLQEKLKQFFYAAREFRKVINITIESVYYFFKGDVKKVQKNQRSAIIIDLNNKIQRKIKQFLTDLDKEYNDLDKEYNQPPSADNAQPEQLWSSVMPWSSRRSENPLDFISDIAAGALGTVELAFTKDPGIATPMFVLAMLCAGALLFPSIAGVIPAQIVNGLQWLPQNIAKAFMGKSLEAGLSNIAINIISNFLQWQVMTYGMKGAIEVCHGNFKWVKKIFEYPEEITLSAATFISLGYTIGLIPHLPTAGINMSHPFFNVLARYPTGIYNTVTNAFNLIIDESRETSSHALFGLNTLELAFIGLKSSLFIYGLLSGTYHTEFTPFNQDTKKLCEDFKKAQKHEQSHIIYELLKKYGITDPNSSLAEGILRQFQLLMVNRDPVEKPADTSTKEEDFITERNNIKRLLKLVRDMEVLGIPIDLDLNKDRPNIGYQSKLHAELIYDELFFAIKAYNQAAEQVGLFNERIDGKQFLHNFYNKHCYTGSSGWHKILFGLLLFPITWVWRGFKYLIGTPSMRHQVKKSFCKDFAMLFQIITDVIAPILRSFLKVVMYSVRMLLGILVLPPLINALAINLIIFTLGLIFALPVSIYALVKGVQNQGAVTFIDIIQNYFSQIKVFTDEIWNDLLGNSLVNGYLKLISFVGSTSGTGSPHRLNLLKTMGAASLYEYLTSVADTSYENVQISMRQLSAQLETDPNLLLSIRRLPIHQGEKEVEGAVKTIGQALDVLAQYHQDASKRLKPVSSERRKQLAYLSESLLKHEDGDYSPEKDSNIAPIFDELKKDSNIHSELVKKLKIHHVFRFFSESKASLLSELNLENETHLSIDLN